MIWVNYWNVSIICNDMQHEETYHLRLSVNHLDSCRQDLAPGHIGDSQTTFQKALDQLISVVFQGIVVVAEAIDDTMKETRVVDGLDMGFHNLTQLLGNRAGCMLEREGLGRVNIEEGGIEDHRHDHEHLMFGKDPAGIALRLQGQREDLGDEMHRHEVSDAVISLAWV